MVRVRVPAVLRVVTFSVKSLVLVLVSVAVLSVVAMRAQILVLALVLVPVLVPQRGHVIIVAMHVPHLAREVAKVVVQDVKAHVNLVVRVRVLVVVLKAVQAVAVLLVEVVVSEVVVDHAFMQPI